jgi:hypothetical protein
MFSWHYPLWETPGLSRLGTPSYSILPSSTYFHQQPTTKSGLQKIVKSKVTDYWENKLRMEASFLPSLEYFHPEFVSLSAPHKLYTSAGSKSFKVAKAGIQLLVLANQYPSSKNTRHCSIQNSDGLCSSQFVKNGNWLNPLNKFYCAVQPTPWRERNWTLCVWSWTIPTLTSWSPEFSTQDLQTKWCNALPEVIHAVQLYGERLLKDIF